MGRWCCTKKSKCYIKCNNSRESLGASSSLCYRQLGRVGVRQNTTVLYPIYYADDDMFRPLWAIFRSQYVKENYTEYDHAPTLWSYSV